MNQLLIVITGSIASGKSTVARGVARELRQAGHRAATIDIDLIYSVLADDPKSDELTWRQTQDLTGRLAGALFAQGMRYVVVEGEFWSPLSRHTLSSVLPQGVKVCFITLRVSYTEALRRAQSDVSRGISKDPVFLARHMESFTAILPELAKTDKILDTETATADELALQIVLDISKTLP